MDLISSLTQQFDLEPEKAQGLAGALIGKVQEQLGGSEAIAIQQAVPELEGWQAQAKALTPESSGAGGLLGAASSLLGGDSPGGLASIMALASNLNLDTNSLMKMAPVVLSFLQDRLSPEIYEKVSGVLPMLMRGEGGGSGIANALGGLFGKN